ncbi:hypothetical protein EDB80DRAFT_702715 [Ilyonectria destructans]|nr:hypothetical protein EDB80DRAFT_702715 [Ilyonectria destructans]
MTSFTQWVLSLGHRLLPMPRLLDAASNTAIDTVKTSEKRRPRFEDLPLNPEDPAWSAWGLWGADDELGTLNLLTEETTKNASEEIKEGIVIPLNLPIEAPLLPMNPARKPCNHSILNKGYANDDELDFNTQSSSHWDGLRHYPYQNCDVPKYYNHAVQDDFTGPQASSRIGIQNMARRGIVGRGVLLDWRAYALRKGIQYSPFEPHAIPLSQLLEVAAEQHVTFHKGDILIIRSGWTEEYMLLTTQQKIDLAKRKVRAFVGVQGNKEMIKWHWDNGFAAVAGDTNAYEAWPPARDDGVCCHEVFLSGWGMPIGEVWDLEELAKTCEKLGRWTFFLTSSPLNLENGVASPSNAIATF